MILAWDTATPATVVALGDAELRHDPGPGERPGHTRELLVLVAQVLAGTGATWDDIELIAVGVGPGSFTGLRIGIATANALALARGLPATGVSSLRALAAGAERDPESGRDVVLAALDARRGEAFAAAWAPGTGEELIAPVALGPAALAEHAQALPGRPCAVGDGAVRFRAELEAAGASVPGDASPLHRVSAWEIARLAAPQIDPGSIVLPKYIRLPDAVPAAGREHA